MIVDIDTIKREYRVECDHCEHQWRYEEQELVLEPWPHFVCPACGQWINIERKYIL